MELLLDHLSLPSPVGTPSLQLGGRRLSSLTDLEGEVMLVDFALGLFESESHVDQAGMEPNS